MPREIAGARAARITMDPTVLAGKPVVAGTRISVDLVLDRLAADLDLASLLESYPRLTEEDVRACLAYAQALVAGEDVFPAPRPARPPGA